MTRRLSPRAYLDAITTQLLAERPDYVPRRFTAEEVDAALSSLPELERAVLLDSARRRRSYRKIARRLGVTIHDVETIMARALLHLTWAFDTIERERE